jgi:MoxR-like ATPase
MIDKSEFDSRFRKLINYVGERLLGKRRQIELAATCVLADGHLLLEDLPGLGKTTLANALADAFGGVCRRVQGTPDLMPADITGSVVLRAGSHGPQSPDRTDDEFRFRPGPIFANVLLCDEVNRTPPRTQSALLEAMEERQVTVFDNTWALPDPFFVIATQNPVDMDGTYPLPEAQLDRFLMRLRLGYPERGTQVDMLAGLPGHRRASQARQQPPAAVLDPAMILEMVAYAAELPVADLVLSDLVALVEATRDPRRVLLGASPRACIALLRAARVYAAAQGATAVTIDHVRELAPHVLAHRLILAEATTGGDPAADQHAFVADLVRRLPAAKRVPA